MNAGFTAHTKQSDEWETPTWLFDALDHEFGFNLDGAARKENAKCKEFSTVDVSNSMERSAGVLQPAI